MPFLASAVRASDPFPATSVEAPEISVSGNFCATKLSAGKLILDRRTSEQTGVGGEVEVAGRNLDYIFTSSTGHAFPWDPDGGSSMYRDTSGFEASDIDLSLLV
jgi:hypothetical protein